MHCEWSAKICHEWRWQAERQLLSLKRRKGYRGVVYKCRHCGGWHVGQTAKEKSFRRRPWSAY